MSESIKFGRRSSDKNKLGHFWPIVYICP